MRFSDDKREEMKYVYERADLVKILLEELEGHVLMSPEEVYLNAFLTGIDSSIRNINLTVLDEIKDKYNQDKTESVKKVYLKTIDSLLFGYIKEIENKNGKIYKRMSDTLKELHKDFIMEYKKELK